MTKEKFLTILFRLLNEANVDYFVYGEYQYLPVHNGNSDIDMLVEEAHFQTFIAIIKDILNVSNISLVSFYRNRNISFIRLLSKDNWGIQFDVTKGWFHKGQIYYPAQYLKDRLLLHNGIVRVLDYNVGLYLDFFKEVINIGQAKGKYIKGFLDEYIKNRSTREQELLSLYGNSFITLINDNLSEEGLTKIIPSLRKQMIRTIHKTDFLQRIVIKFESLVRITQRPGYVIVVEGTDGSGKSFIINSITPILNETFHKGIVYNHLRPHCLPDIAELLGKRKKKEDGATLVVSDPHAQNQSSILGSLVRWSYYMIDYTWGYMRKVWLPIHSKSKVFIFDRYYYEYYIDQRRSHVNLPMWIIHFGEFFIPKPDLILCLGGDPEKIYARKPETSLEEVTRQTKVLKEFCAKRKNAVWIDTTIAPEESINAAMKAINDMMSKRFDINDLK